MAHLCLFNELMELREQLGYLGVCGHAAPPVAPGGGERAGGGEKGGGGERGAPVLVRLPVFVSARFSGRLRLRLG